MRKTRFLSNGVPSFNKSENILFFLKTRNKKHIRLLDMILMKYIRNFLLISHWMIASFIIANINTREFFRRSMKKSSEYTPLRTNRVSIIQFWKTFKTNVMQCNHSFARMEERKCVYGNKKNIWWMPQHFQRKTHLSPQKYWRPTQYFCYKM